MREANGDKPHGRSDLKTDLAAGELRCTARSKATGQRCKLPPMLGGNVCRVHGGAAPQTRAKAQRRLQQAADALVQRLLQFALDGDVDDPTALRAIRDALDRAGLTAKTGVEVELVASPIQQIFERLEVGGSRAEWRRSQGIEDDSDHPPALAELARRDDDEPIDAILVDVSDDSYRPTPDDGERQPFGRSEAGTQVSGGPNEFAAQLAGVDLPVPDGGLVTTERGAEIVAELRRRAIERARDDMSETRRAVVHRPVRALPPGRSDR
ncbi:hypothetical protein [Mycobacterium sp. SMC-4]|uniref:hypothetical protein n=1 Tax=Mycobacterium sp. SMC-4 TaxID=2857059 RepID=UPI003D07F311